MMMVMMGMMMMMITLDQLTDLLTVLGHNELQSIGVIIQGDPEIPILSFQCLHLLTLPLDRDDQVRSWDLWMNPTQLIQLVVVLWVMFCLFHETRTK